MPEHVRTNPPSIGLCLVSRGHTTAEYAWQCYLALAEQYAERRAKTLPGAHPPRALLPADAVVRLAVEDDYSAITLAEVDGCAVSIHAGAQATSFDVAAGTAHRAESMIDTLCAKVRSGAEETVEVTLWRQGHIGATSWTRALVAPSWPSVSANYPQSVADQLEPIMGMSGVDGAGRLLLWTGEPGTGKTSAIRALVRAWRGWCRPHLVADPERFFGDAAYLLEVMSSPVARHATPRLDRQPEVTSWNLVVCEDADDFIHVETRRLTGAGVGRLLNLADGLLGQGLNTIVLLTSNTSVRDVDPALLRPGRCLGRTDFESFSPGEARRWLGDDSAIVPPQGMTLAELFERAGSITRYGKLQDVSRPIGTYL